MSDLRRTVSYEIDWAVFKEALKDLKMIGTCSGCSEEQGTTMGELAETIVATLLKLRAEIGEQGPPADILPSVILSLCVDYLPPNDAVADAFRGAIHVLGEPEARPALQGMFYTRGGE